MATVPDAPPRVPQALTATRSGPPFVTAAPALPQCPPIPPQREVRNRHDGTCRNPYRSLDDPVEPAGRPMSAPALVNPVVDEWNWQLAGACRGMDVEAFFLPAGERRRSKQRRIEAAKLTCQACPVIAQCRAYALRTREPYGVWGGLSEEDRAEILGVDNLRYPAPRRAAAGAN